MSRRHHVSWIVLGFAILASGCDRSLAEPEISHATAPSAALVSDYWFVRDVLPAPVPSLSLSQVIGLTGGSLTLLGHTVTVPAGTVTVPTLFTMLVNTNGYIAVDLNATVTDLLGRVINVGALGFKKPVSLTLTYARSPDTLDPSKLLIVYVNGSKIEPVPSTVNASAKTVTGKLSHFSKYAMASN